MEDLHEWLSADEANVVAVHCKAGKGRTGLIIAAYLVYAGLSPSTTAALRLFGEKRTTNGKGVTIPSQMRYVHYFEQSLKRDFPAAAYQLRHFRLHTVPNFDVVRCDATTAPAAGWGTAERRETCHSGCAARVPGMRRAAAVTRTLTCASATASG